MSCLKKTIIGFGIFLSVLLSAFFVSPSYAIDPEETFTKSSVPSTFFSSLTGAERASYQYMKIECVPDSGSKCEISNVSNQITAVALSLEYWYDSSIFSCGNAVIFPFYDSYYISLCTYNHYVGSVSSFPRFSRAYYRSFSSNSYDFTIKLTLTNSLPTGDCPVCQECQVCPAIPENPYDNKLDNITMAIYTCGGILLVLYFFYCIYRIIIRNSGVNNL